MNDDQRGFDHGIRNLSVTSPTAEERSIAWWRGRRRGTEARQALEAAAGLTEASESHYVYGDDGAFYEDAS